MVSKRSFLFPFKYSYKVSYVVEFSHKVIRVILPPHGVEELNNIEVQPVEPNDDNVRYFLTASSASGIVNNAELNYSAENFLSGEMAFLGQDKKDIIINSPYTYEDLWDDDEKCCKIQVIQHSDVMYIFNENYPIMVLKRYSPTFWKLEELELKNGPFLAMNTDGCVISGSGTTGTITLTASQNIFHGTDEGRLLRLRFYDEDVSPWVANKSVLANDILYSDKKYYQALANGTTGSVKPVHSEGSRSDGCVVWKYLHSGYGVVKIISFIDEKHVQAEVLSTLSNKIIDGTQYWELGMLYQGDHYPKSGAFFRNRFAFLVNTQNGPNVCFSCSGDYNNFDDMEFGEVTSETAITVPVLNTEFNEGKWLYSSDVLFVGTGAAEFYIDAIAANNPMAADNVKISQISSVGSKSIVPVGLGGHVFFVDRYGLSLRDLMYNYYNDGYDQVDVSLLGKHLFTTRIIEMAYQEVPDKILWCVMGDGSMVALTFSAEQEVAALSRHEFSGQVESLTVIPSLAECKDCVWLSVKRMVDGRSMRTVEYLDSGMPQFLPSNMRNDISLSERESFENDYVLKNAMYLDGAVTFDREAGNDCTEISGLDHLNGLSVSVFADGTVLPSQIVMNGKITIKNTFTHVLVGLKITSQYIPQNMFIAQESGVGVGQHQRINHLLLTLYLSGGGKIGENENSLLPILYRHTDENMNTAQKLFSGNKELLFNGKTTVQESAAQVLIENDSPLPMNILAIVPYMDI